MATVVPGLALKTRRPAGRLHHRHLGKCHYHSSPMRHGSPLNEQITRGFSANPGRKQRRPDANGTRKPDQSLALPYSKQ